MDLERLSDALQLSGNEVSIYRFLAGCRSATVAEIARGTRQVRPTTYGTLRSLVEKGLAREEPSRPIRYSAVPYSDVVDCLLAELARRGELLREVRNAPPVVGVPGPDASPLRPGDISTFWGTRSLLEECRRIVNLSQQELVVGGGATSMRRLASSTRFLADLASARRRGVQIKAFAPRDSPSEVLRGVASRSQAFVEIMDDEDVPPVLVVASESRALIGFVHPAEGPAEDDVGIEFDNAGTSSMLRGEFLKFLTCLGGARRGETRSKGVAAAQALEVLRSAQTEVLGLGPGGWSWLLAPSDTSTALDAFRDLNDRGVQLRAVRTPMPPEESFQLRPYFAYWDTREANWVPVWMMVVDRTFLLQAFPGGKSGEPATVRQSDDAAEVAFYVQMFEHLWAEAELMEAPRALRLTQAALPRRPLRPTRPA